MSTRDPLTATQLFEMIRVVCPSFVPLDDAQLEEWQDEPMPPYVRISGLARHLVDLASEGQVASLVPVFALVEHAIDQGQPYVAELAVVGLLEDIQNFALQTNGEVPLTELRALLGPKSSVAWDQLMRFWYNSNEVS